MFCCPLLSSLCLTLRRITDIVPTFVLVCYAVRQGTIDPYADEDDDMWDGGADNGKPEWHQSMLERQRERYETNMDVVGPNQGDPLSSYHIIHPPSIVQYTP